jgi:hypothetical protein
MTPGLWWIWASINFWGAALFVLVVATSRR